MKLTIEATERITSIDGVKARAWKGVTERGVPVVVFVHRIAVDNSRDSGELDRELVETLPPGRDVPLIEALANEAERFLEVLRSDGKFERVEIPDLRSGDRCKLYEPNGDLVGEYTCVGAPYLNHEGVWTFDAEVRR